MKKFNLTPVPVYAGFFIAILLLLAPASQTMTDSSPAFPAPETSNSCKKIVLSPLSAGSTIRAVQLPRPQNPTGRWGLFTLSGTLVAEVENAGENYAAWNGCDRRGVPLASGLYLARFLPDPPISGGAPAGEWTWTKNPENPVMEPGCGGDWDSAAVRDPSWLDEGDTLKAWYTGYDGQGGAEAIGYAYSVDGGDTWNCRASPVLETGAGGAWDSWTVYAPHVIQEGATYIMFYAGFNGETSQVGRATSTDGVNWVKEPANPVLRSTVYDWDNEIGYKAVIKEELLYRMWYAALEYGAAVTYKIGYAESADGIEWIKYGGNPITGDTSPPQWEADGMTTLDVARREQGKDSWLEMWYSGVDMGNPGVKLGSAVSTDGLEWDKDPANPFLEQGPAGSYDSGDLTSPSVIPYPDRMFLFYSARSDLESGWIETLATAEQKEMSTSAPDTAPHSPEGFRRTFPNPFNPSIRIDFEVPGETRVKLRIFDMTGRMVALLVEDALPGGRHSVTWNGRNRIGNTVSSGVYICSLEWDGFSESRKLVLLK